MSSAQEVKLETLQKVREIVKKQEDRFTASKIIEFNRFKYVFGVLKSYISVYVFAAFPQLYWRYHAVGLFCMVPIQVWRWFKIKQLFYMLEYCWVSSFVIGSYLLWLNVTTGWTYLGEEMNWWPPNSAIVNTSKSADGLESGVGGTALQGLWEWLHFRDKSFTEYVTPALVWLWTWFTLYTLFMQLGGVQLLTRKDSKWKSTVRDQLYPPEGRTTFFTKMLGRIGEEEKTLGHRNNRKDSLRSLIVSSAQNAGSVLSICVSYLFYKYDYADGRITFAWIMLVCFLTALNGANWYSNNMTRFTKLVDGMITEEQKKH
ncbi:hypothetical protein CYMTET_42847 [Cymbomonas tetramitiformis]|uniref:Glycerophosphocholine acyltransferase 1 n=1 Tax=Cymbomonas tetramitiformis TaxID=36881 RepID=A0AAE0F285_9CHLO|nr:hypothetical protein CYMTET_42847 [Cymbomonas tetramitiformis]